MDFQLNILDADGCLRPLTVSIERDGKARVWLATSDDVPGLAAQAPSLVMLALKLSKLIPELIALNSNFQLITAHAVLKQEGLPKHL